ncbi:MAG: hypothetical protein ACYSU1_06685 [Planctomycetota bacterium]|jgi:hypothetical protein
MMKAPHTSPQAQTPQGAKTIPRLPWLRIGVEALAIVSSILLAFTIDAWWASRARAEEVVKIMTALETDFQIYKEMLASDRANWESILENMDWLLQSTVTETPPSVEEFDAALSWASSASTLDARSGTVETLLAGGLLNIIPNRELRGLLAETPRLVDNVVEIESIHREFVESTFLPYLTRHGYHADLMLEKLRAWSPEELGIEVPTLPRDHEAGKAAYSKIRSDPEFRVLTTRRYKWVMTVLWTYYLAERNVEEVLHRLEDDRSS